jgi:hypothetical protein
MCELDSSGSEESGLIVPDSCETVIKFSIQKSLTICVIIRLSRKTLVNRNDPAPVS